MSLQKISFQGKISFDTWANKGVKSIKDVDANGNNIYSSNVDDFTMSSATFTAGKNKDEDKIYLKDTLKTAQEEIALYDTNKDGKISAEEQFKKDKEDFERECLNGEKFEDVPDEFKKPLEAMSLRAHKFMDLNGDGQIDEKEYAAFLYKMDSNNVNKVANGKITRDEYASITNPFETASRTPDEEAKKEEAFKTDLRSYYKLLFGSAP